MHAYKNLERITSWPAFNGRLLMLWKRKVQHRSHNVQCLLCIETGLLAKGKLLHCDLVIGGEFLSLLHWAGWYNLTIPVLQKRVWPRMTMRDRKLSGRVGIVRNQIFKRLFQKMRSLWRLGVAAGLSVLAAKMWFLNIWVDVQCRVWVINCLSSRSFKNPGCVFSEGAIPAWTFEMIKRWMTIPCLVEIALWTNNSVKFRISLTVWGEVVHVKIFRWRCYVRLFWSISIMPTTWFHMLHLKP